MTNPLNPQPRKVLVVEDDDAIRNLYDIKLQKEGFLTATATAANGQHGLLKAQEFMPDLILLDLRMPVMAGDEMLLRLRESDWGSNMRVIILTNISKSEAPHSLRFLHVDRYIVKVHTTPSQVVDTVKDVLG
jgi:two-component system, OmpR family, response regulator AdeR